MTAAIEELDSILDEYDTVSRPLLKKSGSPLRVQQLHLRGAKLPRGSDLLGLHEPFKSHHFGGAVLSMSLNLLEHVS